MRRRRIEQTIELRKARKGDQLLKRRNIDTTVDEGGPLSPVHEGGGGPSPPVLNADEIVRGMMSSDEDQQLMATTAARKILSRERNPPIDLMIQCGIVPRCVEFLARSNKLVHVLRYHADNLISYFGKPGAVIVTPPFYLLLSSWCKGVNITR